MAINKKNNRHTTPPQTHIALIMPLSKGIGLFHRSGTWNNQGRQRTTPCDKQYSNRKEIHSKSNDFLSLVLSISPPLNNPVINPLQLSNRHTTPPQTHIALIMPLSKGIGLCHRSGTWNNQGRQRTTPCDKQYSNRKEIHNCLHRRQL